MPLKRPTRLFRNLGVLTLSVYLVAFTSPHSDDLVELKALMNGRSEAKFRDIDSNKIYHIKSGSRGIVKEVKHFDPKVQGNTGNYGICVQFQNVEGAGNDQKCVWVYYRPDDPNMILHSVGKDTEKQKEILANWAKEGTKGALVSLKPTDASKAQAATTTRPVSGVGQRTTASEIEIVLKTTPSRPAAAADASPIASAPRVASASSTILPRLSQAGGVDADTANVIARNTIESMVNMNSNAGQAMNPNTSCLQCDRMRLQAVNKCDDHKAPDAYMQSVLKGMLNDPAYSAFYGSPQKEIINTACIQRNMMNFSTSPSFYRQCSPGQVSGGKHVPRACISEDYLNITSKAFNLVADCMGDYVVGGFDDNDDSNNNTGSAAMNAIQARLLQKKQQAALSVFAFMAQESGMHANAQSATGAGGPGQMTGPAIEAVNEDLRNIRNHLEMKNNPKCSQVLNNALKRPLSMTGAACDRKNPENVIKSMAYAFGYQAVVRRYFEATVFGHFKNQRKGNGALFDNVLDENLPPAERDRMMMEISAWAHNTGPGGLKRPMVALLTRYKANRQKLRTAEDIDEFLRKMAPLVGDANPARRRETSNYYRNIQEKMKSIAPGGRNSCLAN